MRNRRTNLRGRTGLRSIMCLFATGGLVLVIGCSGGPSADPRTGTPEQTRNAGAVGCAPSYPVAPTSDQQYFRLSMQLISCMPDEIPLSLEIGSPVGSGTPLSGANKAGVSGSSLTGADFLWDAGDGNGETKPKSYIARGGPDGNSAGALVGVSTVPWWDGYSPTPNSDQGPCANSDKMSDGTGTQLPGNICSIIDGSGNSDASFAQQTDFKGTWAVYLPTATLEVAVVAEPINFPMVPQYGPIDNTTPGAVAVGLALVRRTPGGGISPIYTQGSIPYGGGPSKSPPASAFNSTDCFDNLVVEDGANHQSNQPGNWSTKLVAGGHAWFAATVVDSLQKIDDLYSSPTLFFPKGWLDTQGGAFTTVPLNNPTNTALAQKQHTFQAYLRYLNQVDCSGAESTIAVGMIGGQAATSSFADSTLPNAVIANSTLAYVDFRGAKFEVNQKASTTLGFTVFGSGYDSEAVAGTPSVMSGVDLANVDLTGARFPQVNFGEASLSGATLYYADLSTATVDKTYRLGTLYCGTNMPVDPAADPNPNIRNDDCNTMPGQIQWPPQKQRACTPADCAYVSVYNNTTRYLSQGIVNCAKGGKVPEYPAPALIGSLETGQLGFGAKAGDAVAAVDCSASYANGSSGKLQVRTSNNADGTWNISVDSGYCPARVSTDPQHYDPCLPTAAPAVLPDQTALPTETDSYDPTKSPLYPPARIDTKTNQPISVKVTYSQSTNDAMGVTTVDVILCEPEAYVDPVGCPNQPALPGYAGSNTQLSPAPLNLSAVKLPSGYETREAYPRAAWIPSAVARTAQVRKGFTVTEPAGGTASVYQAKGLDQEMLARVIKKPGGKPVSSFSVGGVSVDIWRISDGAFVGVAAGKRSITTVTARSPREIKALRGFYTKAIA